MYSAVFRLCSVWKELSQLQGKSTRALLHWTEGKKARCGLIRICWLGRGLEKKTFPIISRCFCSGFKSLFLTSSFAPRAQARSGQAAAPPVWVHVWFLRERTDFRPGVGTEKRGDWSCKFTRSNEMVLTQRKLKTCLGFLSC